MKLNVQISWGKQGLFANFRLAALALPFIWAQLWVPFLFHLLQYFRLQELWWKALKRRPQLYQCCNPINHAFIPQNQRLWFEEFTQLSLRAVPDELWWNWLWKLDVSQPWHSLFSAEGHQRASGTCLVSRWDNRGAHSELCTEQLRQLRVALLVPAPSLQEWEPLPPQLLPLLRGCSCDF